jgi:hypothetical protein
VNTSTLAADLRDANARPYPSGWWRSGPLDPAVLAVDRAGVGVRLRTRADLLAAWRAEAEAVAAVMNEQAEAEAAVRIDAADPLRGAAPLTPDAMVRLWASETLQAQLSPGDPIPDAIRTAFNRAQALLWAGEPIPDAATLVDEPRQDDGQNGK